MSKHIAFLGVAAAVLGASVLGPSALPAAAADYYDGGDRPFAFHSREDVEIDGGRARRAPGPVVFDERGFDRPASRYGEPGYRRPAVVERPDDDDRPIAFIPPVGRPYGGEAGDRYGFRPAPFYRPAAVPVGPIFGEAEVGGAVGSDVGCTTERVQSITPAGWRKTVTHRTCYRR